MKNTLHFTFFRALMILVFGLFFNGVSGQVSIANTTPITENFSGLGSSSGGTISSSVISTLPNWYATGSSLILYTTTSNSNGVYNCGASGSNDRSLGALSTSTSHQFGMRLKNTNALPITSLLISYTGEQWRQNSTTQTLVFEYKVATTVTSLTGTGWVAVTNLDFTSIKSGTAAGIDGNLDENRSLKSATFNVDIPSGSEIMIRWTKSGSNSSILAVEDLSLTPTFQSQSPPVITSATSLTTTVGSAINYTIVATNTPTSFSTSTLPNGLTFASPSITGSIANSGVYTFNVTATNAQGSDTKTVTLTVNQASQTITFPAIANKEYGSGTFQLAATASSGLAVTYVSSNTNVATVTNNVVTVVGIGDTNITASQSGDANYTAATSVIRQLTVTKKNLNVTGLSGGTKIYDSTVSATATGTPILDGVISGDIVDLVGSPSYTFLNATVGSNKTINSTGFSISGSSSSNYQLVQPVLSGTINQKTITVSGVSANNKTYDGTLTAVVSGGTLNGVETSDSSTVGISTQGQFATANAGNNILVNVSLTGASASNYNLTQPNITANITKADQVITFNNIPALNTGSSPVNLNLYATVNSSLLLEYTSSNPAVATVSGNTLTVVGVGTTTITAKQPGDLNHNAATDVTKTVDVVTAPSVLAEWRLNDSTTLTNANTNVTASDLSASGVGTLTSSPTGAYASGWPTSTINLGSYFEISVAPNSGYHLQVTDINFSERRSGTGIRAYQVRYSTDNFATFTLAAEVSVPNNTDERTGDISNLNINVPALSTLKIRFYGYNASAAGGTWRINDESLNLKGFVVSDVITSTTWNGTSWTNGIPTATVDAIIAANYSTGAVAPQGTFTAKSLTVNSGATLTVATGTTLTVENAIVNNNPNGLGFIVQDNADLVQVTDATNTGDIKVLKKTTPIVRLDHTLWSSPVNGTQSLHDFSPNTLSNRFYTYNTASNAFVSVPQTDTFVTGVGYGIRADNNWGTTPLAWEGTFVGKPNNGPQTFTLSASTTIGYNLVGNPYPSSIDALALVNTNSAKIERKLYFYSHSVTMQTDGTFLGNNYGIMTVNAAGTSQSYVPADNSSATSNGKIATGQGFFVKALPSATGTLSFNNTMRTSAGLFYRSQEIAYEKHSVRLKLTNSEGLFSTLLVNYEGDGTQGVDESDAVAFGTPTFYSLIGTGKYKIQGKGLPFTNSDIVPLGFTAYVSGNHTIELNENSGLFSEQNIYLKDNVTGVIHDIKSGSYTFAANSGTYNNRFEIVYQNSLLGVDNPVFNQNSLVVFKKDGLLNVNATGTTISQIAIYDMSGRILYNNKNVDAENAVINDLVSGHQVLIVKVTSAENAVVTKKVIF